MILRTVALESRKFSLGRILERYPTALALAQLLNSSEPEVVLLDLCDEEAALHCASDIRRKYPSAAVIGVGSEASSARLVNYVSGLHAVIPFPPTPEDMVGASESSLRMLRSKIEGNLMTFLPAKAGSGATTIAWHTAAELAAVSGKKVLLIEGDLRSGVLSFLLNLRPEVPLQAVLRRSGEIDGLLLGQAATKLEGVDLLISDRSSSDPGWPDYFRLIDVATRRYAYVLLDAPELPDAPLREVVRRAGRIFLVTTSDVAAVRLAQRTCHDLDKMGIDQGKVELIANQWNRGDLTQKHLEEFLGRPVAHAFPSDHRSVAAAALRSPRIPQGSELAKSFREFAVKISGSPALDGKGESLGGRLKHLLRMEALL